MYEAEGKTMCARRTDFHEHEGSFLRYWSHPRLGGASSRGNNSRTALSVHWIDLEGKTVWVLLTDFHCQGGTSLRYWSESDPHLGGASDAQRGRMLPTLSVHWIDYERWRGRAKGPEDLDTSRAHHGKGEYARKKSKVDEKKMWKKTKRRKETEKREKGRCVPQNDPSPAAITRDPRDVYGAHAHESIRAYRDAEFTEGICKTRCENERTRLEGESLRAKGPQGGPLRSSKAS
ncbi:hypothetical protein DFH06DRAFT_1416904 [Mycena polygramma]|nr:hypothetical protein DFH06DRAFT_1416904 [Mycena polygramma]